MAPSKFLSWRSALIICAADHWWRANFYLRMFLCSLVNAWLVTMSVTKLFIVQLFMLKSLVGHDYSIVCSFISALTCFCIMFPWLLINIFINVTHCPARMKRPLRCSFFFHSLPNWMLYFYRVATHHCSNRKNKGIWWHLCSLSLSLFRACCFCHSCWE